MIDVKSRLCVNRSSRRSIGSFRPCLVLTSVARATRWIRSASHYHCRASARFRIQPFHTIMRSINQKCSRVMITADPLGLQQRSFGVFVNEIPKVVYRTISGHQGRFSWVILLQGARNLMRSSTFDRFPPQSRRGKREREKSVSGKRLSRFLAFEPS